MAAKPRESNATNRRRVTIGVLDDDPAVLKLIRSLLTSAMCEVATFETPLAFLDYAAREQPTVSVVDIQLPQMSGFEVQRRLRYVCPSTQVVVISGSNDQQALSKALDAGAMAFLAKPFDAAELIKIVRSVTAQH